MAENTKDKSSGFCEHFVKHLGFCHRHGLGFRARLVMPHQSGCYRRALAFAADEVIELGKKELVVATFVVTLFKKYEGEPGAALLW